MGDCVICHDRHAIDELLAIHEHRNICATGLSQFLDAGMEAARTDFAALNRCFSAPICNRPVLPTDVEPHERFLKQGIVARLRDLYAQNRPLAQGQAQNRLYDDEIAQLGRNFQHCPYCSVLVERIDGCNHITHNCQLGVETHFCILCAKLLDIGTWGDRRMYYEALTHVNHFPDGVQQDCVRIAEIEQQRQRINPQQYRRRREQQQRADEEEARTTQSALLRMEIVLLLLFVLAAVDLSPALMQRGLTFTSIVAGQRKWDLFQLLTVLVHTLFEIPAIFAFIWVAVNMAGIGFAIVMFTASLITIVGRLLQPVAETVGLVLTIVIFMLQSVFPPVVVAFVFSGVFWYFGVYRLVLRPLWSLWFNRDEYGYRLWNAITRSVENRVLIYFSPATREVLHMMLISFNMSRRLILERIGLFGLSKFPVLISFPFVVALELPGMLRRSKNRASMRLLRDGGVIIHLPLLHRVVFYSLSFYNELLVQLVRLADTPRSTRLQALIYAIGFLFMVQHVRWYLAEKQGGTHMPVDFNVLGFLIASIGADSYRPRQTNIMIITSTGACLIDLFANGYGMSLLQYLFLILFAGN